MPLFPATFDIITNKKWFVNTFFAIFKKIFIYIEINQREPLLLDFFTAKYIIVLRIYKGMIA